MSATHSCLLMLSRHALVHTPPARISVRTCKPSLSSRSDTVLTPNLLHPATASFFVRPLESFQPPQLTSLRSQSQPPPLHATSADLRPRSPICKPDLLIHCHSRPRHVSATAAISSPASGDSSTRSDAPLSCCSCQTAPRITLATQNMFPATPPARCGVDLCQLHRATVSTRCPFYPPKSTLVCCAAVMTNWRDHTG
jgi:hypothetical protein